VVVVLTLLVVTGFLVVTINAGHLFSIRGELQNAVDSAALAGALELDGTAGRLPGAVDAATDFASRHRTDSSIGVVAQHVELGHWTRPGEACSAWGGVESGKTGPNGWQFCRIDGRDATAARDINAVRVTAGRADGAPGGGAAPVYGSAVIGSAPTADVVAEAVAVTGGPCEQACPTAPVVVRAGCVGRTGELYCGRQYTLGLSAATVDTAGWTNLLYDVRTVNSKNVCDVLSGDLGPGCELSTGRRIGSSNGNQWSASNCKDPSDAGVKTLCDWFYRYVGQEMQIPVVEYENDPDPSSCAGGYEGMATIVGFATVRVDSVWCKEGDTASGACAAYATQQCVGIQFVCGAHDDEEAPIGCGWWGTSPLRPQLVR
jgi:hypothetical protein